MTPAPTTAPTRATATETRLDPEKPRATAAPVLKVEPVGPAAELEPELDPGTVEEGVGVLLRAEEGRFGVTVDAVGAGPEELPQEPLEELEAAEEEVMLVGAILKSPVCAKTWLMSVTLTNCNTYPSPAGTMGKVKSFSVSEV